ncbi:hypothetical protein IE53DRAFT_363175 [Violaceomyces palustris]|uniref:Uncharacterized protein n=1 Tax=Violaceomyces palustris TaxID=1673888 RepID=A0ACD0NU80_9BASI|nr:hypothetical protein IE53DRAFT_363175 [Violaceomyces palustris]
MSGFDPKHIQDGDYYRFKRPIKSVAIIGSGPSGEGLRVRIFERNHSPGGTWIHDPSPGPTLSERRTSPSTADYRPTSPPQGSTFPHLERRSLKGLESKALRRILEEHCEPCPVYDNLKNNVALPLMELRDMPWPRKTRWNEPHSRLFEYLRDYSSKFGLDREGIASFNTRVERATKEDRTGEWVLTLKRVQVQSGGQGGEAGFLEIKWWQERFDAIVCASGHYSAPFIPKIDGLDQLLDHQISKVEEEDQENAVIHSKSYRNSRPYVGKVVLLIGCGTSGIDINRDLRPHAKKIYHSVRRDITGNETYQRLRSIQRSAIDKLNSTQVAQVVRIGESEDVKVLAEFHLEDGSVLKDVDKVIFCTGYQQSKPYLADYHEQDEKGLREQDLSPFLRRTAKATKEEEEEEEEEIFKSQLVNNSTHLSALITDGKWVQNLHEDLFYRLDPTLAFVGVPVGTATFNFFEYQALLVSRVFSFKARLPSERKMLTLYAERLRVKGAGRYLHLMGEERESEYVAGLVRLLNHGGGSEVEAHDQRFKAIRKVSTERILSDLKGEELELHVETPLIFSPHLSSKTGHNIFLKLDCLQPSRSFKIRGVGRVCLSALADHGRDCLLVSSSGGNAGLALATSAKALGMACAVYVPDTTEAKVIETLRGLGSEVVVSGHVWDQADEKARERVEESCRQTGNSAVYIHPFEGEELVEGHSSIVQEIYDQMTGGGEVGDVGGKVEGEPDMIVCSVGGGGLIRGIIRGIRNVAERRRRGRVGDFRAPRLVATQDFGADSFVQSINLFLEDEVKNRESHVTLEAITSKATSMGTRTCSREALEEAKEYALRGVVHDCPSSTPVLSSRWPRSDHLSTLLLEDSHSASACWQFERDHGLMVEMSCGAALCVGYQGDRILPKLWGEGPLEGEEEEEQVEERRKGKKNIVIVVCGGSKVDREMLDEYRHLYGDPTETMSREAKAVIILTGSHTTTAGIGITEIFKKPSISLPTRVALIRSNSLTNHHHHHQPSTSTFTSTSTSEKSSPQPQQLSPPPDHTSYLVGSQILEAQRRGEDLEIFHPLRKGRVVDWQQMMAIWRHLLFQLLPLRRSHNDSHVLLSLPAPISRRDHAELTKLFFQSFNTPALCIVEKPLLSAFAVGSLNACVVDVGWQGSTVSPVLDSMVQHASIVRSDVGARECTLWLTHLLRQDESIVKALSALVRYKITKNSYSSSNSSSSSTPVVVTQSKEKQKLEEMLHQLATQLVEDGQVQSDRSKGGGLGSKLKTNAEVDQDEDDEGNFDIAAALLEDRRKKAEMEEEEERKRREAAFESADRGEANMDDEKVIASITGDGGQAGGSTDPEAILITFKGLKLKVGPCRLRFLEPLFDPSLLEEVQGAIDDEEETTLLPGTTTKEFWSNAISLPEAVWRSISSIEEMEKRPLLWESLVVTGAPTKLKSISQELVSECSQRLAAPNPTEAFQVLGEPNNLQPRIVRTLKVPDYFSEYKDRTDLAPFLGGTIYAKLVFSDPYGKGFITKQTYNEQGPTSSFVVRL